MEQQSPEIREPEDGTRTYSDSRSIYTRSEVVWSYLAFSMFMISLLLSSLFVLVPSSHAAQNAKAYYVRQGNQIYYVRVQNGRRYVQPVKSIPRQPVRRPAKKKSGLGGLLSLFGLGG